ncbi:maleylacetoacetate isomerase [Vogesella sp. LYT5W]|uniref:Maleylacetoacetate isomerase n=1 Tax=Vogesella margarita TaxID=2984199 RepID=A0ABT5IJE0_9NEIS|nr:maleylacetoacetate isomerase [Vogesella margarita]MDC7712658.1 maleylacetoacetate isomerase [Vogesella margarita]
MTDAANVGRTLYGYFRSSAAYRVRIALNLKGLAYAQAPVSLLRGEQRGADYLALNPQGLVPALLDKGVLLTQSLAICEYLDEAYPDSARLLPDSAVARAQVRAVAQAIACDIHPLNNLRVLNYLKAELGQGEDARNGWYRYWVATGFAALEQQLAGSAGLCCFGDTPTLADVCLLPQVFNAQRFAVDMDAYPLLARIAANLDALPAFADAHPSRQPDAQ